MYYEISNKRKLLLRLIANTLDALFILVFIFIFTYVMGMQILISMVWSSIIACGLNILMIYVFPNNYSLGLKMTRLTICDIKGGIPNTKKLLIRQLFLGFYWIPFLNAMLILTNIIAVIIYKTNYIHDFLTKTLIINESSVLIKVKKNAKK